MVVLVIVRSADTYALHLSLSPSLSLNQSIMQQRTGDGKGAGEGGGLIIWTGSGRERGRNGVRVQCRLDGA